ncbi:pantoate--beta-alanine ligase [Flectobacillus sp. DC10W]|jgi:pantoate--beta-alanine ligase|uniref:Pantothenate synthetase n=1 Tax=Flectobacillus longus TaxID=2984207 RepID=A0ABT6YQG2_9BACT|nr:pantoate--beta-alanine ligase [Flectobacillus longus]MDI9865823.1 pantoate--beta-alanine ligase [Flectobacillus longus]
MLVFHQISVLQEHLKQLRNQSLSVGFVPTMGALHQGHISLINQAKAQSDIVVCSIFVNPTQFNNAHDLAVYPRTLEADSQMLDTAGCDILFAPSAEEMYPQLPTMKFDFGTLETVMEGAFRPGHFNGVGIVVSKLFHIVQPNKAFFGQKDLQQCAVISCMVNELSFNLELIICPTQREEDGLAMSSRNRNLSPEQRAIAPAVYQALLQAKTGLLDGQEVSVVKHNLASYLASVEGIELEYFEISDFDTLLPFNGTLSQSLEGSKIALCIAAFLGKTRLIDNIII